MQYHPPVALPAGALAGLNTTRQQLHGINAHPLPAGTLRQFPNGLFVLASGERRYALNSDGTLRSYTHMPPRTGDDTHVRIQNITSIGFRPDGTISHLRAPKISVFRATNGSRKITWRPDADTLVVATAPHRGFVQHTLSKNGTTYLQRTYVRGTHLVTRTTVGCKTAAGLSLSYYPPRFIYPPGFYGWAYEPWGTKVGWRWPRYYGGFFLLASIYTGPSPWLTDFILGETAEDDSANASVPDANYADTPGDPADADPPYDRNTALPAMASDDAPPLESSAAAPLMPETRQTLTGEVATDVAQDGAVAAAPDQAANVLDITPQLREGYVFLVDEALFARVSGTTVAMSPVFGTGIQSPTCLLSAGDTLTVLRAPLLGHLPQSMPADYSPQVSLQVTSSRKHDCPAGTQVLISESRLQDMDNSFRAHLDNGMAVLHDAQGKAASGGNGAIPAAPQAAVAPAPVASDVPPVRDSASAPRELNEAQTAATRIEKTTLADAFASDGATAPQASIASH
jgi:hypothetical protein